MKNNRMFWCMVSLLAAVQALVVLALLGFFWMCLFSNSLERPVPRGYIRSEEYWDPMGFRDSTDFCIYTYDAVPFGDRERRYKPVTEDDIETIRGYFANFANRMSTDDRMDDYTFDDTCITVGDYVYICTKGDERDSDDVYETYKDYSVYFFDTDTLTLYLIHYDI